MLKRRNRTGSLKAPNIILIRLTVSESNLGMHIRHLGLWSIMAEITQEEAGKAAAEVITVLIREKRSARVINVHTISRYDCNNHNEYRSSERLAEQRIYKITITSQICKQLKPSTVVYSSI